MKSKTLWLVCAGLLCASLIQAGCGDKKEPAGQEKKGPGVKPATPPPPAEPAGEAAEPPEIEVPTVTRPEEPAIDEVAPPAEGTEEVPEGPEPSHGPPPAEVPGPRPEGEEEGFRSPLRWEPTVWALANVGDKAVYRLPDGITQVMEVTRVDRAFVSVTVTTDGPGAHPFCL